MTDHESTAEREGIVDQQDAALEAMDDQGGDAAPGTGPDTNTAEREGIVDQQDAVLETMAADDEAADAEQGLSEG